MNNKTLLLGNGLNRTLENSLSWRELMKELGSTASEEDRIPFPIDFEQIAAKQGGMVGRRRDDAYKRLREKMSDIVTGMDNSAAGEVHQAFKNLGQQHVITTNYDSLFESMYDCEQLITNPGGSKNILKSVSRSRDVDFYHAHGIGKWKNTLCLSHEHYISLITKIRTTFFTDSNDENKEILSSIIKGEIESTGTWPELLFTTDVAIVGLGLDYSEIDLWWLLAQRAALFSPCHQLSQFENSIVYYYVNSPAATSDSAFHGRMHALEALGVEVRPVDAADYPDGYLKIAKMIQGTQGD